MQEKQLKKKLKNMKKFKKIFKNLLTIFEKYVIIGLENKKRRK